MLKSRPRAFVLLASAALVLSSLATAQESGAASTFTAVGSVGHVYVTGLTPSHPATLVTSRGATVATQNANALGGTLFRNVKPANGYRVVSDGVTSPALTVHNDAAAPW